VGVHFTPNGSGPRIKVEDAIIPRQVGGKSLDALVIRVFRLQAVKTTPHFSNVGRNQLVICFSGANFCLDFEAGLLFIIP
jgi:hypothetical protein